MRYRLIALDVDGTIRSRERPISQRTRDAIDRVREAGAFVTLATGRSFRSAASAAEDLRLTTPIVTFQGAHVAFPTGGEPLWHLPLTPRMTRAALSALDGKEDLDVMGYVGDDVILAKSSEWARDYVERHAVPLRVVDADSFSQMRVTRLVARGEDDAIERLERELIDRFDGALYVTRSLSYFCEILHPDGGKEKALEWLCARLGVKRRQTIAFGNGYNDVRMLRWAGLSVAVDDAVPQALAAADVVAPPMEQDGVARVLDGLLERGMIG